MTSVPFRLWFTLALVGSVTSSLSCGRSSPEGFRGWMTSFVGTFETVSEDETATRFVQPWAFPCADCYFVSTEWGRREVSLRFTTAAGERVRLRLGLETLNADGVFLSVSEVPPVIEGEGTFSSDPPEPGHASLYKNGVAIDEGGEIEVFDAMWPVYPGDEGAVTLRLRDTTFQGESLEGAFRIGLTVTEGDAVPPGYGEVDAPCAEATCFGENARCVEEAQRTCRRQCVPGFLLDGCPDDQACVLLDGPSAVCQPGVNLGARDRACRAGDGCDDDLVCADVNFQGEPFEVCREICVADAECGPGSRCDNQACVAGPPAGFRDGACDALICYPDDTVCVGTEDGRCRKLCEVGGTDVCGLRSVCAPIPAAEVAVCVPASGRNGPCPCDDGLTCSVIEGEPPTCRPACDPEAEPNNCPADAPTCFPFVTNDSNGVCF